MIFCFCTLGFFFNGRFIIGNDYVRMYVTLVGSSWVVVASVLTGWARKARFLSTIK